MTPECKHRLSWASQDPYSFGCTQAALRVLSEAEPGGQRALLGSCQAWGGPGSALPHWLTVALPRHLAARVPH